MISALDLITTLTLCFLFYCLGRKDEIERNFKTTQSQINQKEN